MPTTFNFMNLYFFIFPSYLTNVNVALHDRVEAVLVDSRVFHSQEGWLEESLRSPESLVSNSDDLSVRKLVGFLKRAGAGSCGHLLFEVQGNVAQLLL